VRWRWRPGLVAHKLSSETHSLRVSDQQFSLYAAGHDAQPQQLGSEVY
jgi:NOL1/NOP2/fmu family ribosome biogenesis protein